MEVLLGEPYILNGDTIRNKLNLLYQNTKATICSFFYLYLFKKMKIYIAILTSIIIFANTAKTQEIYRASSLEMIFSFANINQNNNHVPVGMRYTAFFHTQQTIHFDFKDKFGFYTGLGIRNIGFTPFPDSIYSHKSNKFYSKTATENKFTSAKIRTYTIGLPIAFKFGNFKKGLYFYAGGEIEYSFHFKEKIWLENTDEFSIEEEGKNKYTEWFGDEVTLFLPSIFAGVKLPQGVTVSFKWYLQNFLNTKHEITHNNITVKPYEGYDTQIFYVSLALILESKKPKAKPIDNNSPIPSTPQIDM